jgi:hypothetical protein
MATATNPTHTGGLLMVHIPSPVEAIKASGPGALPGYESICSCGLQMRNTIRINVDLDVAGHLRWAEGKARRTNKRPVKHSQRREVYGR